MKRALVVLLLSILLFASACTGETETAHTDTVTETDERTSVSVTEEESASEAETEPDKTETAAETEAESTEELTQTDIEEITAEYVTEPVKTDTPVIKGYVLTEPGTAMIYGECEEDSVLTVRSELEEYTAFSDGRYFAVSASLYNSKETSVRLSACADGKTESEEAFLSVKNNTDADYTGVAVTLGSRVIEKKVLPDQYGTNSLSQGEIETITDTVKYRKRKAEKAAGKPVNIVYIIVPDPLTVYPEELTEQMKEKVVSPSARMKQAVEALKSVEGVTVVDLTDTMNANKQNGKLYYKLDSHWTELGAFYGYQTVMKTLGLPYHELSDYKVDYIDIDDTDMNVYSGVGTGEMYESAPFLTALFEEKTPYGKNKEDTARIWSFVYEYFSGQTSKTVTDEGPSAIFLFDSYGLNIISYLAEHFGTFVTQPIWKYSVDYSLVSEVKPDYIIELLAERNLDELLYAT